MRYIFTSLALLFLCFGEGQAADAPKATPPEPLPEISIGSPAASVTVIEYSSLTCGHCATFNNDVLPKIREKYVDPGKVRFVFRDYPADQLSLQAHQLAWCTGSVGYPKLMNAFYTAQQKWLTAKDPLGELKKVALNNGLTQDQIDACLKNTPLLDKIVQMRLEGQQKYKITATPTFIIQMKVYPRGFSFEEFSKILDSLLDSQTKKVNFKEELKNKASAPKGLY